MFIFLQHKYWLNEQFEFLNLGWFDTMIVFDEEPCITCHAESQRCKIHAVILHDRFWCTATQSSFWAEREILWTRLGSETLSHPVSACGLWRSERSRNSTIQTLSPRQTCSEQTPSHLTSWPVHEIINWAPLKATYLATLDLAHTVNK